MWNNYERRYRKLGPRFEKMLRTVAEGLSGFVDFPCWPWHDNGDDYGWHLTVERSDGNKFDVSIALIDSHDASGDHAPGVAGAIRLDFVEDGGLIVGGMAPYNYTDKVWTRYRDAAEFDRRMRMFEDVAADYLALIVKWLEKVGGKRKLPPAGSRCEETSMFYSPLPCFAPAEFVVKNSDPKPYNMCAGCADHNVKNRGAHYVLENED